MIESNHPRRHVSMLVLASASPRRKELLTSLGIDVVVIPSTYEELDMPGLSPLDLARHHARGKASNLAPSSGDGIIVAADTVVDVDGVAFGKPRDLDQAASMLSLLSGRSHRVHTAFAVVDGADLIERDATTDVQFYALSAPEIARYVATGDSMDKAGAYGIQGRGAALVERIDGDFYTVMGFPLGLFVRTLAARGIELGAP